jgi:hypothetical protein
MATIYFRNLENITIAGKEGQEVKKVIYRAIKEMYQKGLQDDMTWLTIKHEKDEAPTLLINLKDVIAVR